MPKTHFIPPAPTEDGKLFAEIKAAREGLEQAIVEVVADWLFAAPVERPVFIAPITQVACPACSSIAQRKQIYDFKAEQVFIETACESCGTTKTEPK